MKLLIWLSLKSYEYDSHFLLVMHENILFYDWFSKCSCILCRNLNISRVLSLVKFSIPFFSSSGTAVFIIQIPTAINVIMTLPCCRR